MSFKAHDASSLLMLTRLMAKTKSLYLQGLICPLPTRAFHVSKLDEALKELDSPNTVGNIVLTFEDSEDQFE